MRLDEWQKFIESQFLEEEAPLENASAPIQPALPLAVEETEPLPAVLLPEPPLRPVLPFEESPEPAAVALEPEVAPVEAAEVVAEQTEEAPSRAEVAPEPEPEAAPAPALPQIPVPPVFETRPALEADIPSFESYLKPRAVSESVPTPPTLPPIAPVVETEEAPEQVETPGIFVRRSPKTRARHARNVRPENVPSGLSAADLWAAVPKHVQTLLALQREEEVAQYSYKRPFEENRQELIARLLDPVLTLEETARLLNVCPTTVRRYTNKGILTHYRKEPERRSAQNGDATEGDSVKETRQRRFRLSDILAFLEAQQSALEADREKERARERKRRTDRKSETESTLSSHSD